MLNNIFYKETITKKILDFPFYIFYMVFLLERLFWATQWNEKYTVSHTFALNVKKIYNNNIVPLLLVYAIAKIFFSDNKNYEKIAMYIFVLVGKLVNIYSGEIYIFIIVLLVCAAQGISGRKIIAFSVVFNLVLLVPTVVASQVGFIENHIEITRNRQFLGFGWTTTPVMIFCYSVFSLLFLYSKRINFVVYLLINLANFWLFMKTNTRFAFVVFFVVSTVFCFFYKSIIKILKLNLVKKMMVVFPWICALVSFLMVYFYDESNTFMTKLNHLLSYRLSYCKLGIEQYGITFFGQPTIWNNDGVVYYIDSAYIQFTLKYGFVIVVLLLLTLSALILKMYKYDNFSGLIIILFLLLFGITEQQLFWLEYDSFLLLLFADMNYAKIKNLGFKYEIRNSLIWQ